MGARGRFTLACIGLGVMFGGAPSAAGLFRRPPTAAALEREIARAKNPVKKSELQMQLARLTLQQGVEAYDQNNFAAGKTLLERYLKEVQSSWATLKDSGRNAVRQPEGFKQLDIAFSANDRQLGDLRRRVAYPASEIVKRIEEASRSVHAQVLDALFPGLGLGRRKQPARPSPDRAKRPAEGNR